ncbi:hypothetical protein JW968_01080 [Candidatus Woesearchaeota archaeon]|nr:hypothetical protein [Candidatus Woesearchaeota archaeon]
MTKFPEVIKRRYTNVFVCRRCKSKIRAPSMKVARGEVSCRKCNSKQLRAIKKK